MKDLEKFQLKNFKNDYRLKALLKLIPKTKGEVLDIGSGNGEIAIFLSKTAKMVYATDNSKILLKKLREKTKKISNFKILWLNAENFSFRKKFDLIIACDIAEHLKNDINFFKNCYFHLKKGGKIFISVPAGSFLYGIRDKNYGHYRRYNKKELIKKIKKAGFEILKCQYWNFIGFFPYLISEKIFKKPLVAPARHQVDSVFSKLINKFLYFWLFLESKIIFLPLGLSLIVIAEKK